MANCEPWKCAFGERERVCCVFEEKRVVSRHSETNLDDFSQKCGQYRQRGVLHRFETDFVFAKRSWTQLGKLKQGLVHNFAETPVWEQQQSEQRPDQSAADTELQPVEQSSGLDPDQPGQ